MDSKTYTINVSMTNVKKTFERLRSEINFVMDLYKTVRKTMFLQKYFILEFFCI